MPEQYQDLIWFLFPSEVIAELLKLKKGMTFEALEAVARQSSQTDEFTTPFIPKDYNKFKYAFQFSRDLMGDENAAANTDEGSTGDS